MPTAAPPSASSPTSSTSSSSSSSSKPHPAPAPTSKCKKHTRLPKYCSACGESLPTNQRCPNCAPKKCSTCGKPKKPEAKKPDPLPVELWICKDGKVKGFARYQGEDVGREERENMGYLELGMWGWFAGLIGKEG